MAAAAERQAVTHTFIADCETPVSAFLKLRGDGPAFLLESAEQGQHVGRYSFIGVRPRGVLRWSLGDDGDPYAMAQEAADLRQATFPGAPPFTGGAVGFFGYDLVRTVETTLGDSPVVIRQKLHTAEPMTVDDALYEMEMVGHDFFLFVDIETSRPSVAYRRRGWTYGVVALDTSCDCADASVEKL